MQPLKKTHDGFIQRDGVPTDVRFVRLESPDADVKMVIAFYKGGPPGVSVFPVYHDDGPWNFASPPEFKIVEDGDGAPMYAEALLPCCRMGSAEAPKMIEYLERVKEDLALMDAVVAAVKAGETWKGDPA